MSENKNKIHLYELSVEDTKVSPFETIDMLHIRSQLEKVIPELENDEITELLNHDVKLINNAKRMVEHISKIYNFSSSLEPLSHWWWHLDKIASGEVTFKLSPKMKYT